jgi:lactoylglutathione lyase
MARLRHAVEARPPVRETALPHRCRLEETAAALASADDFAPLDITVIDRC